MKKNKLQPKMPLDAKNPNDVPDLSADDIIAGLRNDFWKKVLYFASVDSTNELAMALSAENAAVNGTVVIADCQKRGRGRLGRKWVSPPGRNVYMSVILKTVMAPAEAVFLTVAASTACAVAIRNTTGLDVRIKWPNDLMVEGKKIGGILAELRSHPAKSNFAVIGMGINVNSGIADFPEELRGIATSVREESGKRFSRAPIIVEVLRELENWYRTLINGERPWLLKRWKELSSTTGKKVIITVGSETFSGLAVDIDEDGMLLVQLHSGDIRRISAGDLTELR